MMPYQDWHFYSTDPTEPANLKFRWDGNWIGAQSFWTPLKDAPGVIPVFRCYNPQTQTHFWSIDRSELGGKAGYQDEGPVFYVFSKQEPGTSYLHRFNLATSNQNGVHHFYTADVSQEHPPLDTNVWRPDNPQGFVYATKPQGNIAVAEVYRFGIVPCNWRCNAGAGGRVLYSWDCDNMFYAQATQCCQLHANITRQQVGPPNLVAFPVVKK